MAAKEARLFFKITHITHDDGVTILKNTIN